LTVGKIHLLFVVCVSKTNKTQLCSFALTLCWTSARDTPAIVPPVPEASTTASKTPPATNTPLNKHKTTKNKNEQVLTALSPELWTSAIFVRFHVQKIVKLTNKPFFFLTRKKTNKSFSTSLQAWRLQCRALEFESAAALPAKRSQDISPPSHKQNIKLRTKTSEDQRNLVCKISEKRHFGRRRRVGNTQRQLHATSATQLRQSNPSVSY
jgi:hypothetical protein